MKIGHLFYTLFCFVCIATIPLLSYGLTFDLPDKGDDIVGRPIMVQAEGNLAEIGLEYNVGAYEMIDANRQYNPRYMVPSNSRLVIPQQFILPKIREGIVINLAELRLYYFPKGQAIVKTYPIAIGRVGWNTPTGVTQVVSKIKDPVWRPTQTVREAIYQREGKMVGEEVLPGPDNPLGPYGIRLGFHQYLIHGNNDRNSIGLRISSGCIRMLNEDVTELFSSVSVGTKVTIINEPVILGWQDGKLYLKSIQPLSDDSEHALFSSKHALALVQEEMRGKPVAVNWEMVHRVGVEQAGMPRMIGIME